jgi:hypothetical protein
MLFFSCFIFCFLINLKFLEAEMAGVSFPETLPRSSSTGNKISLPQHSLFSMALNASTANSVPASTTPVPLPTESSKQKPIGKIIDVQANEEGKIVILHENQPLDCWRRKIEYPDDGAVGEELKPKLFGLWGNFTKVQQSPEIPFPDALALANKYHYRQPPLIKNEAVLPPIVSTDQPIPAPLLAPDGTAAVVVDEDPVLTPLDIANKVLAKVRARTDADTKCDATPSNLMKRKILEAFVNATKLTSVQVQRNKKIRGGTPTTSNTNAVASNEFRVILGHVPMDDGGLKVVPINHNVIPTILHDLCSSSLCGFCFTDLSTTKPINYSLASTASSDGGSFSKKEKEENNTPKADPNLPMTFNAGALTVNVHGTCKHMIDRGQFLPSTSSTPTSASKSTAHSLLIHSKFYEYEDAEDAKSCSLCGKSGGLLFPFDIPTMEQTENNFAALLTLADPDEEEENEIENEKDEDDNEEDGENEAEEKKKVEKKTNIKRDWVAHIPCLQYLHLSQSLNLPSFQFQQHEMQKQKLSKQVKVENISSSTTEANVEVGENNTLQVVTEETSPTEEITVKSLFEEVCHQYRCMLCGMKTGIVLRCLSVGCAVRAHPICVSLIKSWAMTKVKYTFPCKTSTSSPTSPCTCPMSCNSLVYEDEKTSTNEDANATEEAIQQQKIKHKMHSITSVGFLCGVHKR